MKQLKYFVFLLLLFFVQQTTAANNQEFRAVWVITWQHSSSSDDVAGSKARIIKILDNIKKANMNAVLWQVRQGGMVYYNSAYEPWGPYSNGPYPGGYDPFAFAVEQAHKRGLEIHAWFNVFAASHTDPGTPAGDHPEWVCRDRDGNPMQSKRALSPGLKAVRDYTLKVAMEVVRNYDIDGLHMDYIRWNEYSSSAQSKQLAKSAEKLQLLDGMITPEQIEDLNENQSSRYLYDVNHPYSAGVPTGYDTWEDWWRDSVTKFVHALHDSIQSVKPWVRLSAAALGNYRWGLWQGYGSVYQDAALWFNKGYVDQLTPMHYYWTTGDGFYGMLTGNGEESWRYWISPGIDAGRLYSVGPSSSKLADDNVWYRHKEIVERCRTIPWVDGFQFFSYGDWQDYRYWETAARLFFQNKTKVRAAKFLVNQTPSAPTFDLTKMDSLKYRLTITPPEGLDKNQRFVVYRSADDTLDVNNDEIVDIHFGKKSYSVVDTFSGTQDFNGKYTYFATMLDRYWNESKISNALISDSIPSFAPKVIATYPTAHDSLPVNEDVVIYFSKTMRIDYTQNFVKVSAPAQINGLTWSDGNKTLTISFSGNLAFNTLYTLTISDSLTDVNGKRLDGKGDGGNSEPFVFTFRTLGEDKIGPKIIFSNFSPEHLNDNVDVQAVATIAFNELLNTQSLSSDNIQIFHKDSLQASAYLLNMLNQTPILSVQPKVPFGSMVDYTIRIGSSITDTVGNPMIGPAEFDIRTEAKAYDEEKMIDELRSSSTGTWEDPEYSGSTVGTIGGGCTFGYTSSFYLPNADKRYKKHSAQLNYQWDPDASEFLLREYCSGGAPKSVTFDTSYTLQCYVYGDGSGNQFRFSLYETAGQGYPLEVSKWHTINWLGWKIVEWDLSDPNSVGSWLGDEIMNGSSYHIDSFQLTHPQEAAMQGTIYFKNLRVIKKKPYITGLARIKPQPHNFILSQNYPNPFNPTTRINFTLPVSGKTILTVYNMLGQKVRVLINKFLPAGTYQLQFNGSGLASGMYVYELRTQQKVLRRRMILLK